VPHALAPAVIVKDAAAVKDERVGARAGNSRNNAPKTEPMKYTTKIFHGKG